MEKDTVKRIGEKIFKRIKMAIDFLAIISVFGILIYRIDTLRKICKDICLYVITWYVDIELITIKNIYLWFEKIFRISIAVFIACQFIRWILELMWEWWLKRQKGNNRFEESLFRYLHDSSIPRCFLITGEWGSGKTYEAQRFFDKYYRCSRTKVFRISCFGLDSRKELVKEISNAIEQDDKSFYTLMIKVLQFIPIIGTAVEKFLKKTYGYDTVKEGSIFIFDDFERITSRAMAKERPSPLYNQSSFFLSSATRGRSQMSEFKEIKEEFKSVKKSFQKIEDFVTENLERIDIDKYNIVIGLINDIVEMYGMKVVIICNSEVLGEKFVHDILRSKLNCIEYRKIVSPLARISIIDNCLKDKVFEDQEKQDRIKEYLNKYIKSNMDDIVFERQFDNLRMFGGLLEAFIITANIFDKKDITNEFLNSLFNSIMITHNAFYNKKLGCLSEFQTGANIEFLARLYCGESPRLIRVGQGMEDVKWVDIAVSGYWILNLSFPLESGKIVERWKNYKYNRTETLICENRNNLMSAQEYNLLHIFYYQKTEDIHEKEGWDCSSFVDNALKEYDLKQIEVIQNIIDSMGEVFHGSIYQKFFTYLFDKLIQGHENENISGNTYIHDMYNNFRVKKELH